MRYVISSSYMVSKNDWSKQMYDTESVVHWAQISLVLAIFILGNSWKNDTFNHSISGSDQYL